MIKLKLFPVLALFCILPWATVKTQTIDIFISEYSASNINGPTDFQGQHHDWVEIRSSFNMSVSLQNYYLSNDRFNLLKWKFPDNFTLNTGEIRIVWLSGRNVVESGHVHANFTLDQCRGQWLILTTSAGVIRDSIFVRPTMANHSRGRIGNLKLGHEEWRVFANPSFLQPNNALDSYLDYAPTPEIYVSTATATAKPNSGGFFPGSQICVIKLGGKKYHQPENPCFNVFYTTSIQGSNSNRPVESYPAVNPTRQYVDSTDSPFPIDQTTVVRAMCVQNMTATGCPGRYLPSFIETNTYFIEPEHQTFDPNFGVLSLAFDEADTSWFNDLATRTVHVEYYDQSKQLCEGYAILTNERPPSEKWLTAQKGFYLTMDDRLGFGCGFEGPIFNVEGLGTSTRTMFPTLHCYAGDIEAHSLSNLTAESKSYGTGMRDVFLQTLAAKYNLNVNPLHIKPIVTVKEGKYYGTFSFKEVYDRYYEEFYNGQGPDSLTLNYVQAGSENHIRYFDNTKSAFAPTAWRTEVYNTVMTQPMQLQSNYKKVMDNLDHTSLIDYMIVNTYAVNQNLWTYDVAFAKGGNKSAKGGKWHYYLWNMPSTFSFTDIPLPYQDGSGMGRSACHYQERPIDVIADEASGNLAFMGVGNVFKMLMSTPDPSKQTTYKFQLDYRNRYMDLLNGPFKCENLLKHFDFIYNLYEKEMARHEDPGQGKFGSTLDSWKGNMDSLRTIIEQRCYFYEDPNTNFSKSGCFGIPGPYELTVDVEPAGAGTVKLNRTEITEFKWTGKYFSTPLSFKAIPTSTNYVFHHWEFSSHTPLLPASMDSTVINFFKPDNVVAVFTDKSREIQGSGEGSNVPTGFTPNGDGLNDIFRPLGSADFANNYEMAVFNRWGQEVFRSTSATMGWDGNYKGQPALTGVYAYVITYTNSFGESKLVKGNITLTR